jgi:Cu/Ag efflux protein CusF
MPAGARPAGPGAAATLPAVQPPVPAGSVAKARLQRIDAGRGVIEADVAGRTQSYGVKEPRRLGSFREGDMVLLTFDRNGYVTSIASATLLGRVTSVNSAAVTVNVDGREETYGLTKDVAKNEAKKLRVGDMIRFEFEDRPGGLKVITAIQ